MHPRKPNPPMVHRNCPKCGNLYHITIHGSKVHKVKCTCGRVIKVDVASIDGQNVVLRK